jgi:hypothetical protein
LVLSGSGFSIDSFSARVGVGAGGGISYSPTGTKPDPGAKCKTNSIGFYADATVAYGPFGGGGSANYGSTQDVNGNGFPEWHEYGGTGPGLEFGMFERWGFATSAGAGVEITRNF